MHHFGTVAGSAAFVTIAFTLAQFGNPIGQQSMNQFVEAVCDGARERAGGE